jgi:chromate transporter
MAGGCDRWSYHQLRLFIDPHAIALITLAPMVITIGFIGDCVAGLPGAFFAALGVFLPVYVFVVVSAPYGERYARNSQLIAFIDGVTSAAIGAMPGAVVVLGRRAMADISPALMALAAPAVLFLFKIFEPIIAAVARIAGVLLFTFPQSHERWLNA